MFLYYAHSLGSPVYQVRVWILGIRITREFVENTNLGSHIIPPKKLLSVLLCPFFPSNKASQICWSLMVITQLIRLFLILLSLLRLYLLYPGPTCAFHLFGINEFILILYFPLLKQFFLMPSVCFLHPLKSHLKRHSFPLSLRALS